MITNILRSLIFVLLFVCTTVYGQDSNESDQIHHLVITGLQFGDEGKGALVDYFAQQPSVKIVIRYNGGNNAGHSVQVGNHKYKFRGLPSGVISKNKLNVIAAGSSVNPTDLLQEIARQRSMGLNITPKQLRIYGSTIISIDLHQQLDQFREQLKAKSNQNIGTTGRGIGPAYEDKYGRRAIRAADLLNLNLDPARISLKRKIKNLVAFHYPELKVFADNNLVVEKFNPDGTLHHRYVAKELYGSPQEVSAQIERELYAISEQFAPYIIDQQVSFAEYLESVDNHKNSRILYEGSQGVLLDIDHGAFPFVTSSHVVGTSASVSTGYAPKGGVHILGVAKVYLSRVGLGPFPSKLDESNPLTEQIRQKGRDISSTMKRPLDIGWFDLILFKHAVRVSGANSIALTKVDVLDDIPEIKVVTGYYHPLLGKIDYMPRAEWIWDDLQPIYTTFPGWSGASGAKNKDELDENLIRFVAMLENETKIPISIIKTGPERNDQIILDPRLLDLN